MCRANLLPWFSSTPSRPRDFADLHYLEQPVRTQKGCLGALKIKYKNCKGLHLKARWSASKTYILLLASCITESNLISSKKSVSIVCHVRGALLVWKENFWVATIGVLSPGKLHPGGFSYGTQGLYHHEVPEQAIQIPPQVGGLEHQLPYWYI